MEDYKLLADDVAKTFQAWVRRRSFYFYQMYNFLIGKLWIELFVIYHRWRRGEPLCSRRRRWRRPWVERTSAGLVFVVCLILDKLAFLICIHRRAAWTWVWVTQPTVGPCRWSIVWNPCSPNIKYQGWGGALPECAWVWPDIHRSLKCFLGSPWLWYNCPDSALLWKLQHWIPYELYHSSWWRLNYLHKQFVYLCMYVPLCFSTSDKINKLCPS